ncbi:ABC transporter permease [Lederbergia galactosidilytica]|uniref:Cell division protein FtsX n=1 Tax=Lederbergia galactosidilytica TaxID=217031 RepID=A0A177ZHR8_9BACI|nr:FtsX-like permease family protein [Lederbergia galactosidilytica]KRG15898.1 cell division protein FtsX [Virgibacillus soli]MBP1916908.1 putative ABC transport system permease protein [Lederbergia galactosidilytica]OAK67496.1 cell division protein FtsX [Lederbergia galactosidilytica]
MNIVNKLTIRHLIQNKRRTLVTIIGVIISVAMLTAVATIGVSFMDLLKRQTISEDGEWHLVYHNVDGKQIEKIRKDANTEKVILSRDLGFALLDGGKDKYKPYLFIKEYNEQGFEQFPIELSSGRFPQMAEEIVISDEMSEKSGVPYKIGDVLTLDIGERYAFDEEIDYPLDQSFSYMTDQKGKSEEELRDTKAREFTIVGIIKRPTWEAPWSPGYTAISYFDEEANEKENGVNASVVLKKLKGSIFKDTEEFAEEHNIPHENYEFNHDLLRYSGVMKNGGMRTTLYTLSAIIMLIIIVGSVSLIYNAFAISVSERSRHLGMLSSVGATRQQKRNSVFFEGAVIGLISIPIGIIAGLIGMGITFMFINQMIQGVFGVSEGLRVTVTASSILIAVLVSILTIFISTFIPARRASRVSAIDAIRQTADVKLTGKAVKTSKLVRKLFGIEAEIGLKNLKRNKRRYQATVFSLVISIILFLTVSYFTDNLKKSAELSQIGMNYDMSVGVDHEGDDQLIQSIISMDEVTDYNIMTQVNNLKTWIDPQSIADPLRESATFEQEFQDGKYPYYINLYALKDENLKKYAKEVGADYNQLQNGLAAIVIDKAKYEDGGAGKYVETKAIHTKTGEKLDLYTEDWETGKETNLDKITIATLTNQLPMGVHSEGLGGLNLIVSEATLNQLGEGALKEEENNVYLYLNSKDPLKTQKKIEEVERVRHYIHNVYQNRQEEEQLIMLLSVFTYGFISLITAISIANILNTISTSISLRKREFAMLKSMGMTPKGFNKMINYESIFYGVKALLYGLPLSIAIMLLIYRVLMNSFSYPFTLPWLSLLSVVVAVFLIVGIAMLYSSSKVKKENIIDALKQENI